MRLVAGFDEQVAPIDKALPQALEPAQIHPAMPGQLLEAGTGRIGQPFMGQDGADEPYFLGDQVQRLLVVIQGARDRGDPIVEDELAVAGRPAGRSAGRAREQV